MYLESPILYEHNFVAIKAEVQCVEVLDEKPYMIRAVAKSAHKSDKRYGAWNIVDDKAVVKTWSTNPTDNPSDAVL